MKLIVVGGTFREIRDGDSNPKRRMGGSGLTAAIVAARLGAETSLASYVGNEDADTVLAMLDATSVDHSAVEVLRGASGTFVFPTESRTDPRPWPMYRPAEAIPTEIPQLPNADAILAFGIPDFDPIARGWLEHASEGASLIWISKVGCRARVIHALRQILHRAQSCTWRTSTRHERSFQENR